jgi:hypothetical protein
MRFLSASTNATFESSFLSALQPEEEAAVSQLIKLIDKGREINLSTHLLRKGFNSAVELL